AARDRRRVGARDGEEPEGAVRQLRGADLRGAGGAAGEAEGGAPACRAAERAQRQWPAPDPATAAAAPAATASRVCSAAAAGRPPGNAARLRPGDGHVAAAAPRGRPDCRSATG